MAIILLCGTTVFAKENYNSYTYDLENNPIATSDAVSYADTINGNTLGIGNMKNISDLFSDSKGNIYIADNGNNRIVIIDEFGNLIKVIDKFIDLDGNEDKFANPQGLFVTDNGNLYVADTDNGRIVEIDTNGSLVRTIANPKSAVLGKDFIFKPSKVVLDKAGRIYVVSTGCVLGILEFNARGEFNTCLGAAKVRVNLVEYFWKLISTDEQLDRMQDAIPTEYNNITIDKDGFLYLNASNYTVYDYVDGSAVSLRRINPLGEDVLKSYNNSMPFGDKKAIYSGAYNGGSVIVDTAIYDNGMFALLDSNRGRVFVYNSSSRLMFCFGGPGNYKDTFKAPSSILWIGDNFYISDSEKGTITIFTITDYGKNLISAAVLHNKNDYEQEDLVWNEIMSKSNQSSDAVLELGLSAYRNGDMKTAMKHFKSINDTENYSKAYSIYRQNFINENAAYILLVVLGVIVIIASVTCFCMRRYKQKAHSHYVTSVWYTPRLMFRPLSGFWDLVREKEGTILGGITILGVTIIVMFVNSYGSGFIFTGNNAILLNPLVVLFKILLPVLLYSICNWCVTSLMDGEATFKQILMSSCYAVSPIIALFPIATLLSNFMILQEGELYKMIMMLAYIWLAILFICANKQIHDYSFGKSLLVLFITLLVMAIIVYLFLLILLLSQQVFGFGTDIFADLKRIFNI